MTGILLCCPLLIATLGCKNKPVIIAANNCISAFYASVKHLFGYGVLYLGLNNSFQRSCAIYIIISRLRNSRNSLIRKACLLIKVSGVRISDGSEKSTASDQCFQKRCFAPALGLLPLGMKALHAMSFRGSLIYNMTEALCFESVRAKYQIVSERGAFERLMAQMMPRTDALKMP